MAWSTVFALLFVTIGPVRPSMTFFALTRATEPELKRAIAFRAVGIAALVVIVVTLVGEGILSNWQVSVDALLIGGGAILFLSAVKIVLAEDKPAPADSTPPAPTLETAIYPLATPLIATPHGLVAVIAIGATMQSTIDNAIFFALILAVMGLNLLALLFADKIYAKISPVVLKVIVSVLGVLLSAIAVQFIIFGFDGLGLIPNPEIDVNS